MKSFLEYVASDIIAKWGTDLSRTAVVFPNKRARLFMNEHLARLADKPLWSPAYLTISELFRQHSPLQVADPIKLVCDLHKCFVRQTGFDETLDHFYGWGQVLLADFDDVDKNMAPAQRVLANLRDLHELDDVSYLTEEQKDIIRKFFANFSDEHNSLLKERFIRLWSRMGDIYDDFNQTLAAQGLAYEGALYRQVAQDDTIQFGYDRYLFVGFNVIQQVEQTLFRTLMSQGKAHFYWDFDQYYMHGNEAGHYIAQYLADFPNELDSKDDAIYDNFRKPKSMTYVSAATENIQGRYVSQWLQEQGRIGDGRRTAIVLCDEALLQAVVHALPDAVEKVNITTGYPLAQAPITGLVGQLIALQTLGYASQTGRYRLKYVGAVLKHPYAHYLSERCDELLQRLNEQHVYYPSRSILALDEGLEAVFTEANSPQELLPWLTGLLQRMGQNARDEQDPLFQEALFRTYTLTNRLCELMAQGDLQADIITLQRLIQQLTASTTIPFHGEPAEGVQVMGVLETRNLDFDHVLVLSCNEGNMPRGVNDTSFIPYSLRKAYGLTTIDHKVAIYAYYFHRLLQRAQDITLTYNNATSNGHSGEMSRFMLQIMVESPHVISYENMQSGHAHLERQPQPIDKTAHIMQLLRNRFDKSAQTDAPSSPLLTPTAINRYMRCPLQFFYNYVSGLSQPEEEEEGVIDNRIFGNIFHEAAQTLYQKMTEQKQTLTAQDFEYMLKNKVHVEQAVDDAIRKELFKVKDPHAPFHMELNGMQMINREVIIHYLRQLLTIDRQLAPFTILGLEYDVIDDLDVGPRDAAWHFTTTIGGRIDRLDQVADRVRVIDYKTGSRQPRPLADIDAIFEPANLHNHSDYYLQTLVYANILRRHTQHPVSPALLFIQRATTEQFDPTLCFGQAPILDVADTHEAFASHLHSTVDDIFNPEVPFTPTQDLDICRTCPYKELCGL